MFQSSIKKDSIPLYILVEEDFEGWLEDQTEQHRGWIQANDFKAQESEICLVPDERGRLVEILVGSASYSELRWILGDVSKQLPQGNYHVSGDWNHADINVMAVGWALGLYEFNADRSRAVPMLYVPNLEYVLPQVEAVTLVRDLVNAPANVMMPEHLAEQVGLIARQFAAGFSEVSDSEEVRTEYPALHAVGRASEHPPRMIRLDWGDEKHPHICLVGKGICFDTGGLDIKSSKYMRIMKKDMGGAAHCLGLALMIMSWRLPIRLTVLIAAADNAISGDAFRPGDVIDTRSGKTVEIDNTDAEGRLVLCDALAEACDMDPALIIDFATLTGAARVALGTEVPVFFTNHMDIASGLQHAADEVDELIWELPLYEPYLSKLNSPVADIANGSSEAYGGAITAALFLQEFVNDEIPWVHFDIMAWNNRSRPGRPVGGEAMGLFAVFDFLENSYGDLDQD